MIKFLKSFFAQPAINYSITHPLFNESILQTNFYDELQKNGWCEINDDKPDSLLDIVSIKIRNLKRG